MTVSFNDERNIDRWFSHSGGVWTNHGTNADGDYFDDSAVVDDAVYFNSYYRKHSGIRVNVGTPVSASTFTVVWEYYNASGNWVELPNVLDSSNGFQNSGEHLITWDMPTDWQNNHYLCDGTGCPGWYYYTAGYNVRARIAAVSGMTEGGANSMITPQTRTYAVWIKNGGAHDPEDIYNEDQANGWGVMTRDASGKMYLLNANLIIDDGQLNIRNHDILTVGKVPGNTKEHFNIEINSNGTLQLGQKDANGFGYNSGTLIWNNGHDYGRFTTWLGNINIYASTFCIYRYGYAALTLRCVLDIVDSILFSCYFHTWYIHSLASGSIKRTLIGGYSLYVYSPSVIFDGMNLGKGEQGQSPWHVLSGAGTYFAKITNMDFQNSIKATVIQKASLALVDCDNFQDSQFNGSGTYTVPEHLHRRFTFNLKVIDEVGNPVENATVILKDIDGRSALFEDFAEIYSSYPEPSFTYITDLDSPTDTSARVQDSSRYEIGDIYRVRGELIKVTAKPTGTTLTVERNLAGSTANGVLENYHLPYHRVDSMQTNSDGEVYYMGKNGNTSFQITVKDYPRLNGANLDIKDFNPFTLTISKAGYQTYTKKFTLDKKTDWTIRLKRIAINIDQEVIC